MIVKYVYLYLFFLQCIDSFINYKNKYHSRDNTNSKLNLKIHFENLNRKNYNPFGKKYYEEYIKKLNSRNITIQNNYILNQQEELEKFNKEFIDTMNKISENNYNDSSKNITKKNYFPYKKSVFIIKNTDLPIKLNPKLFNQHYNYENVDDNDEDNGHDDYDDYNVNSNSPESEYEVDRNGKLVRTRRNDAKTTKILKL